MLYGLFELTCIGNKNDDVKYCETFRKLLNKLHLTHYISLSLSLTFCFFVALAGYTDDTVKLNNFLSTLIYNDCKCFV